MAIAGSELRLAGNGETRGSTGRRVGRWLALVLLVGTAAPAAGQAGTLAGRVVSAETGTAISGAHVQVAGGDAGALTNLDGRYLIRDLAPGLHSVAVRVIGFAAKTVTDVEVAPGTVTTLDVALAPEAVAMDAITVTAAIERGSATALLRERRTTDVVVDAIGAEQISRSPDGDAAAVLARSPGVSVVDSRYVLVRGLGDRYGAASLNGTPLPSPEPDKKVVPLDVVPSSFLESVVTTKTYSPRKPGDYAGGLVEIRTRNFPARPITKLSVGGTYDTRATFASGLGYAGGSYDFLATDDGTRALPATLPRRRLTGSQYTPGELESLGEAFIGSWGPEPRRLPAAQSLSLAVGDRAAWFDGRVPVGYIVALNQSTDVSNRMDVVERVLTATGGDDPSVDYRGSATTRSASVGGMANFSIEPTPAHRLTLAGLYSRTADDEARVFQGYNMDFSTNQRNTRIRYLAQEVVSGQLKGEHRLAALGDARVDWRGSVSRASRYEPNTREVLYRQVPDGRYFFDTFVQSGSVFHSDLAELAYGAAVDVEVPFRLAGRPAALGLGGAADYKDREAYARRFRFLPMGGLPEEVREREPDELFTPETIGPGGFQIQEATFPGDNYLADQEILAGYAVAEVEPLPRLRLSGGARLERAAQAVVPLERFLNTEMELEPARLRDTDLLPALNATYAVTDVMNLRLGLSRTLARPQFRELAPFQFTDYAGGFLTIGNPALERTRIQNLDVRWEWFPGQGSLVAVSGFYKRFERPIETIVLSSTELMRTWVNAESAANHGAELEVRAPLGGLGAWLAPIEVNANLTWVESEVTTGERLRVFLPFGAGLSELAFTDTQRPLQGQSPYVVNLGASYTRAASGTTVDLLYNHFGRRIQTVGGSALPDIYEEGRGRLDLVIEQALGADLSAKLGAKRLLGAAVAFTQGGETVRSYDLGRVISLSASWNPGR